MKKKNKHLLEIILFVFSYVFQLAGLIPMVWALTMRSTFEYRFSDELKQSSLAELIGVSDELTMNVKNVDLLLCIGLAVFIIGIVIMFVAVTLLIVSYHYKPVTYPSYLQDKPGRAPSPIKDNVQSHSERYTGGGLEEMSNYAYPFYGAADKSKASGSLVCFAGHYKGFSFPIESNEKIVLGTDPQVCNIVISSTSATVSRCHCSVKFDYYNNVYVVTDYSVNGTYVFGGKRLPLNVPVTLKRGTMIFLGNEGNSFRLE